MLNSSKNRLWAIIPAAGAGKRFGTVVPKQYLPLQDKPVIVHALSCLMHYPGIQKTVVVVAEDDTRWSSLQSYFPAEKLLTVYGGAERPHSVYAGLLALQHEADANDWVLVHDAVRPCLRRQDIDRLVTALLDHPVGGLLGVRVRDTLKRTDHAGQIISTLDRQNVWQAQTPQMFRFGLLLNAMQQVIEQGQLVTDDAGAIEAYGHQPLLVEGAAANIKITYPEDLVAAEHYLYEQELA